MQTIPRPYSPAASPRPAVRRALSQGSVGDIPLSRRNVLAGLWWLAVWALVCALAVWGQPAQAQALAWAGSGTPAATSGATAGTGATSTVSSTADPAPASAASVPPALGVLQTELVNLIQGRPELEDKAQVPSGRARIEVVLGQLDPRLKLAPCAKVNAFVPAGTRLWGRTRVALRCEQGAVRWQVYWPVTVKVWGPAVVAVVPLRPGMVVSAADLRVAEVDLAESSSPAIVRAQDVIGRSVLRAIEPGQGLRQQDVRLRRYFAAGDPVNLTVRGDGFAVASAGTALSHGDEGQCARIRMDTGKVVCGQPTGERRAELTL